MTAKRRGRVRLATASGMLLGTLGVAGLASALPLNAGHRGFSASYPENTLVAVENSFLAGADVTEIDLLKSSDGHVVIIHDDTVDRTTNGTGRVDEKTLAELQMLDAGSWFDPAFAGETIPTLLEALTLQQQLDMGPLLLDQKEGLLFGAEIVAALLATGASATDDIMVTAWTLDQVNDIHSLLPGTPILWTALNATPPAGLTFAEMKALGISGLSLIFENYTASPTLVDDLHAEGMLAYAWNADVIFPETPEKMEQSITLGLDGYIVNDPALYATVLVPEPCTALLLVSGLFALAARRSG
jgi:glycerophosphoryl diester phosphodiesterase